jgi:hypothetical protein
MDLPSPFCWAQGNEYCSRTLSRAPLSDLVVHGNMLDLLIALCHQVLYRRYEQLAKMA